jgi:hypothetical protein
MMVRYFGKAYDAPIYKGTLQIPTPDRVKCMYCEEFILMGEDGFIDSTYNAFHRECWIRMILGSVAHQSGTCSCFTKDGGEHDPPDMTRREAAKLALAYSEGKRR